MNIEQRLDALEDAHRALAARNEALLQICKVILPIAAYSNQPMVRRLLTSCYDITTDHMNNHGMDDDYQTMVRETMDEISNVLLLPDTPPSHPNRDASAP